MTTCTDIEASFLRFLTGTIGTPHGIKIFDDKNMVDYDAYDQWVVIDTLSLSDPESTPKQMYFLHVAVKRGLANGKKKLLQLLDLVQAHISKGTRFEVYSYDTGLATGQAEVSELSLSPILQHPGGGSFRSLTLGIVYGA